MKLKSLFLINIHNLNKFLRTSRFDKYNTLSILTQYYKLFKAALNFFTVKYK